MSATQTLYVISNAPGRIISEGAVDDRSLAMEVFDNLVADIQAPDAYLADHGIETTFKENWSITTMSEDHPFLQ